MSICHAGNGEWGEWTTWTRCTVTCGEGIQTRYRMCDNPVPANGGEFCEGGSQRSGQGRNCNRGHCLGE